MLVSSTCSYGVQNATSVVRSGNVGRVTGLTATRRSRFSSLIQALRILKLSLTSSGIGVCPMPFTPLFLNDRNIKSLAMVILDDLRYGPGTTEPIQTPGAGEMNVSAALGASAIPVAAATPLIVSVVPTAANTCAAFVVALNTKMLWPPTAGGRATLLPAAATTASWL